jgi:hypothetical protein
MLFTVSRSPSVSFDITPGKIQISMDSGYVMSGAIVIPTWMRAVRKRLSAVMERTL